MDSHIKINNRKIGPDKPVYIVAELSANHGQDLKQAIRIIHAAKDAGADAVKLQTYTPDTMTIQSKKRLFRIRGGTNWDGKYLYDLYGEAYTPWEWHPKLKTVANKLELDLFSSVFDGTALHFLKNLGVPAYKIASFELVDIPLLERVAKMGKPIIMSTGMATYKEIQEAITAVSEAGASQVALLKCTSAYPAKPKEMNLRTIPHMAEVFHLPVGLSDHTLGTSVAVTAVAIGACLIEKHFILSRKSVGPDSSFSMEPGEFKEMVKAVRMAEKALGRVVYGGLSESKNRSFRRSLFIVIDLKAGGRLTNNNVRSIRPSDGLHPRHFSEILRRRVRRNIKKGTPLAWDLISDK